MQENHDPDGLRLPIKLDTTTNGEFAPFALPRAVSESKRRAMACADSAAKRLGVSRRGFLKSLCGAASTLLAINEVSAGAGKCGGFYQLPAAARFEEAAAQAISGDEFIFDIQCHHVNPQGGWRRFSNVWTYILRFFPQSDCGDPAIECFSAEHFIREVFLDSDTDLAVLSAVPAAPKDNPLSTAEAAATRALVAAMEGPQRLLIHGLVLPNLPGMIEGMREQKERHDIAAWKTYTQWGPEGEGYWLDSPGVGIPFIEKARSLGVRNICVHKGIPLFRMAYQYSTCRDIGVVAKRYPDVNFIVYHAGYEPDRSEGAYKPAQADGGVDTLIKSLLDNDIPPNANVYAELGSTWRYLMREPGQAAHVLGKLFKYVGPDNVLWGTDSIWYGSPQDQIQAFRTFQIAEPLRERFGYPEMTPELRRKVFGLNAAKPYGIAVEEIQKVLRRDRVARVKAGYVPAADPSFRTNGPRTVDEFLALQRLHGGMP